MACDWRILPCRVPPSLRIANTAEASARQAGCASECDPSLGQHKSGVCGGTPVLSDRRLPWRLGGISVGFLALFRLLLFVSVFVLADAKHFGPESPLLLRLLAGGVFLCFVGRRRLGRSAGGWCRRR